MSEYKERKSAPAHVIASQTLSDYEQRKIPGHEIPDHVLARIKAEAQGSTYIPASFYSAPPVKVAEIGKSGDLPPM